MVERPDQQRIYKVDSPVSPNRRWIVASESRLAGPILSLGSLLASILLAELLLHVFAPVPDPYETVKRSSPSPNRYISSEFPRNYVLTTEAEAGLPGLQGPKRFSTNNLGFRGQDIAVPKTKNEFRIFTIGGSTTECFYLDDSESLHMILQKELTERWPTKLVIKVYGAGKSGDASDDHVSMLVNRIVHLQPDLIVVFSGINDLTRSIYHYDYLHYLRDSEKAKYPVFRLLTTEFQIPRRLYYLLKRIGPTEKESLEKITLISNYQQKIALRKSAAISNDKPRTDLNAYSNNLRTIIGTAAAHEIRLVFMTQQTTWNSTVDARTKEWQWMLYRNGVTYREQAMDEAIESLNDVMRNLSHKHNIALYDTARSVPKSIDYFYDDVHFNVRGADTAGKGLASLIVAHNLIPKQ